MKLSKIFRGAKIALSVILVCVLLGAVVVLIRSFDDNFLSGIAEKIPVVNNFVVKTYDTDAFAVVREDTAILKVARYDIDFLASFTAKGGRYVALFPFVVEAELPLEDARLGRSRGSVVLPSPVLRAHLDQEKAKSSVFMNTLDLDYDAAITPVLEAFQEKSLDYAREDAAFMESCREKAVSYVSGLFPKTKIAWASPEVPSPSRTDSANLPVSFFCPSSGKDLSFTAADFRRDDFAIRSRLFGDSGDVSFRFGFAGHSSLDFASFTKAVRLANEGSHVVFRFHDPVHPDDRLFFSFVDEGYKTAFVYLRGADNIYYVDAMLPTGKNDEYLRQCASPNVLYLAASAGPAPVAPSGVAAYRDFLASYGCALDEARAGRFGRRFSGAVAALDSERAGSKLSTGTRDAELFGELSAVRGDSYGGVGGAEYRTTVGVLQSLTRDDCRSMDASFRESAELAYRDNDEASGNLEALFWLLRDDLAIPADEAAGYKDDLVRRGISAPGSLIRSLDAADRNILYENFFANRLGADVPLTVYCDENERDLVWMYYGKAANDWIKDFSQKRAGESLANLGMTGGRKFILVFGDPVNRAGLFTNYNALVIDDWSVTLYYDFAGWFKLFYEPERLSIPELRFDDGSFTIGNRTYRDAGDLASALRVLRDSYSSPSYNRDELVRIIKDGLAGEILARLSRPALRL
jgi:hypothetical protein